MYERLNRSLKHVCNCLAEVFGGCLPADVRRARTFNEYGFNRVHDRLCCIGMPKMLEHHRTRPDLTDWIGDVLAIDVRRRAMNRLEQRRKVALGIDVRGWRNADGTGAGGTEIGQD